MIGQILDRRYRIIKVLGSGAFGQTYLAADTHRPGYPQCVVKQLRPPSNNPRTLQIIQLLFKKKAESLEKLGKHDQVPQLLAFFEDNKEFYLVEEFIPGHTLASELVPGQPLPEDRAIRLLQEILEILVFVHGHGMVHRDIKPANLIRRQPDGKLVLIDFGPVKEISYQLMNSQEQAPQNGADGSGAYVSPEQSQGNPLYNSDIYAVGTIGIQALTGLSAAELPKPSVVNNSNKGTIVWRHDASVSSGLADIIDKMVHPDFGQRYQSATEVLADLKNLRLSRTVPPPPPPPPPRVGNQHRPQLMPAVGAIDRFRNDRTERSRLLRLILAVAGVVFLLGLVIFMLSNNAQSKSKELKTRGLERAKSGDRAGAIQDFNQEIQLNPNNPEAYYNRANAQYDEENFEAAVEDYTQVIRLDPSKDSAYFNRGFAQYKLGNYAAAIDDYTEFLKIKPNDADAYYKRGLAYHELGDYKAAIEDYSQAIRRKPKDVTAYVNRGLSRSASGDKQGAIADYTEAIQLDSQNGDAYYNRGRSRFFLADYQGAMEDYTEAIQRNPENAAIYTNRCAAYLNLGDFPKAIADCSEAIGRNPKDESAYGNRCLAYVNLAKHSSAIEDCTKAIQINPNNAKAYSNRGLARSGGGDKEGAIDDYTQAIRLVPSDPVAFSNRGAARADLKNYAEAIADFTQAIRLKPDYDAAYYSRGLVRIELGDKPGAIEDFQKSATLCLDQGKTSCYNLAQTQLKQLQPQR